MKMLRDEKYAVERIVMRDALEYESGELIADDDDFAAVKLDGVTKCVIGDITKFYECADKYDIHGPICLLGAPEKANEILGIDASPCVTFAYLGELPPPVNAPKGVDIKRLAPTLAETIAGIYGKFYTVAEIERLMREKAIFGAITGGNLAGFIGMHADGNIGIFAVKEKFRRRGIGSALERFMINYIMTFGRTPVLDVFTDNIASLNMQKKIGLTPASGHTFWGEIQIR